MVKIILPAGWTQGRKTVFEVTEGLLPDVIRGFTDAHPDFRNRLLGADSNLLVYINLCVNDEIVPRHQRATTTVEAGSTITVMAPMAGG